MSINTPAFEIQPSTLRGIKRKAKVIGKTGHTHLKALDIAAQASGFENYHHARRALSNPSLQAPFGHSVFISAYWRDTSTKPSTAGLETLEITLPRKMPDFLTRHQCSSGRNLKGFRIEYADHLEMRSNADSQQRARELIVRAALALQFIEATGLRPATTQVQLKSMQIVESMPYRDHPSRWIDSNSGAWIVLDEPYEHVNDESPIAERLSWALESGVHLAKPNWGGLYYPGNAIPHFISSNPDLLSRIVDVVESLPVVTPIDDESWPGLVDDYYSQFVSPARAASGAASGTQRKPRPGTTYGYRKNAVEYLFNPGHPSLWRPAKPMTMDSHAKAAIELKRLSHSRMSQRAASKLGHVRSTLEDWMYAENRAEDRDALVDDLYYGGSIDVRYELAHDQLSAIERVHNVLSLGYADCTPKRDLLRDLEYARTAIAGANRG